MDWFAYAENEARLSYGDRVTIRGKGKGLLKFGKFDNLGTSDEMVWNRGGTEVLPTTNAIDKISSSSGSDTGTVVVEGHTVVGTGVDAKYTFVIQTVTLAGQTETALATPLARASRLYNPNETDLVGGVYVYEDDTVTAGVPQTTDKIHLRILAGEQQSYKCATTFSNTDYAFITGAVFAVNKKQTAVADFEIQVRSPGGVFRPQARVSAASDGSNLAKVDFRPFLVVPKNSDVRVTAAANAAGVEVNASFQCVLASVLT